MTNFPRVSLLFPQHNKKFMHAKLGIW